MAWLGVGVTLQGVSSFGIGIRGLQHTGRGRVNGVKYAKGGGERKIAGNMRKSIEKLL